MLAMTKARVKSLNEYREELYMNINDFARHLGISAHTFYKIMKGERVNYATVHKVADRLKVKPGQIAEFARKPSSEDAPGDEGC